MASAGGKKKAKNKAKNKGMTMDLNTFLADVTTPGNVVVSKSTSSWADEVEEDPESRGPVQRLQLPTAPRAARGTDIDMDRVPTRPPFTAYIGNLPFDVEDHEIETFFHSQNVVGIRIPEGRVRKFGYVEFADQQNLLEALALDDQKIRNNQIRVDLAEGQREDRERDRRSGFDRDRDDDGIDRTVGDWRKRDPADSSFSRDRGNDRDRGFGDRDRYGGDRDRYGGDRDRYGGDRDRGFGDRDRDRGFGDRDRYGDRDRGFGDRDRYGDRDRGYGDRDRGYGGDRDRYGGSSDWRDNKDRSFGDRDRGYGDRDGGRRSFGSGYRDSDRGSGRYSSDRYGGRDDRYGGYRDRYDRRDDDRGPSREGAMERPRLKLQPRTKPVEQSDSSGPPAASAIFGGAKPVDTAAREREIEERLKRQRDLEAEKLEQEKENRENRLSSSTSERGRHSSQGEDTGPRRERKSSSSSGKGIRTVAPPPGVGSARIRRDSTLSEPEDVFEEEKVATKSQPQSSSSPGTAGQGSTTMSGRKEEVVVPAPPPKENPWTKRLEAKSTSSNSSVSEHKADRTESSSPPKVTSSTTNNATSPSSTSSSTSGKVSSPKDGQARNVQPAPAPKTNAWSKGKPEIVPADPPKENAWTKRAAQADPEKNGDSSFSGSHWGSHKRREGGVVVTPAGRGDGGGRGGGGGAGGRGGRTSAREKREKPLPKSIDEMPQYSEKSDKDWTDVNKFSSLMAEEGDDGSDQ